MPKPINQSIDQSQHGNAAHWVAESLNFRFTPVILPNTAGALVVRDDPRVSVGRVFRFMKNVYIATYIPFGYWAAGGYVEI
jgi:hypothetical protein